MFKVYTPISVRASEARTGRPSRSQAVVLVPIHSRKFAMHAKLQWLPRLQLWDATITDPSITHLRARMAKAKRLRTDNLLDAAAFAASNLASPFT